MRRFLTLGLVVLGLIATVAPAAAGHAPGHKVQFTPLGVTCGPAFFPTFCAVDMSGDGNTILLRDRLVLPDGSEQMISGPPEGWNVVALSDDGSTVVGNVVRTDMPLGPREEAAIWLGGDQWQPLGGLPNTSPCGFSYTSAFDVTVVAGEVKVVGLAWIGMNCANSANGFSWTESTGMVDLGRIVPGRASRVNVVSADGNVLAGWSDTSFGSRLAAEWRNGGAPTWYEPDGSPIFVGEATGISSDGAYVVGGNYGDFTDPLNPSTIFEPWIWSAETGVVPLGSVKGLRGAVTDGQHFARDVSDDGRTVVGQDTLFQLGEQWAFVWFADSGIDSLQNFIRDNSDAATAALLCNAERSPLTPCGDWDLWNTAAISNDGKTIIGTGRNPSGLWEAFKVTIP